MALYGSITWQDAQGKKSTTKIADPTSSAALQTLAGALETYSNAVWIATGMTSENASIGTPSATAHKTVETKAVIMLRETATQDIYRVAIPAPKDANFDYTTSPASVTSAVGTAVAGAYNTATGKTTVFAGGVLRSKPIRG